MLGPDVVTWFAAQASGTDERALYDAFISGVLQVTFSDGRIVRYRDLAEIERAMSARYGASIATTSRRPAMTVARLSDGLV